jgi:hypothetical protein
MKNLILNLILVLSTFFVVEGKIFAQGNVVLDKSKVKLDPTISPELQASVISSLERAVKDYAAFSTLFDKNTKTVNSVSVNKFIALFDASTAVMCKDYLFDSLSTPYDINDYFMEVMNGPLSTTGLDIEINDAILSEMNRESNSIDQIISKVILTKVFKNYIQNGGSGYYFKPKARRMELTFKTPSYYPEEALITSVEYYSPEGSKVQPTAVILAPVTVSQTLPKCKLIDANSELPSGVNEDTLTMIESLICEALDKYKSYGSLLDSTTGSITSSSASKFQQLFSSGSSLHLSDYREYPDNIEVATYREDVFKFFRTTGIQFNLIKPMIKAIEFDPDGFYFIRVSATKEVPIYLEDESYEIKESGKHRAFDIEFKYVIAERTMSDPLIEQVIGTALLKPEEKSTIITFGPNFTSGLVSGKPRPNFEYITDKTNLSSTPGFGFQVDILSNFIAKHRALKKPFFLSVGISFQSFNLQAEATDLIEEKHIQTIDNQEGILKKNIDILKDQIPLKIIGMPLGMEYRLIGSQNKKFKLFLGGKFVLSYFLNEKSSFDSEGLYNLTYDQFGFTFYDDNRNFQLKPGEQTGIDSLYKIGNFYIKNKKGTKLDGKFLMGYKLESSILFDLSPTLMLNARIGYGGYFGEILVPSIEPKEFPLQEKPKENTDYVRNTLIQEYYTDIAVSYLSFTVGLAFKLY